MKSTASKPASPQSPKTPAANATPATNWQRRVNRALARLLGGGAIKATSWWQKIHIVRGWLRQRRLLGSVKRFSLRHRRRVVFVADVPTNLLVFCHRGKMVAVRPMQDDDTPLPLMELLLNPGQRGKHMVQFLRFWDAAIHNLELDELQRQRKYATMAADGER